MWIKSTERRFRGLALLLAMACALPGLACDDPARDGGEHADPDAAGSRSFEIRVGERVRDWCERLGRDAVSDGSAADPEASDDSLLAADPAGIATSGAQGVSESLDCAAVRRSAGRLQFSEPRFAFVPPPVERINRFEGLFVPGRYTRASDESVDALIRRLLEATARRLERGGIDVAEYNIPGLEFGPYRQLILASIVEKEAASNRGYEGVAAVFLNRLRDNEVLGSCPTVEYALGYHRPFLLFKDLELKSPYNVYKRRGLPPTPIAFFSDGAFDAVRRPIDSAAYFFVFDWTTGDLIFADDYGAHKRNAAGARKRFIAQFGEETIYKRYDGLFYEMPAADAPDWASVH